MAITTAGVLGGWLPVMTATVVTIALRMREFDPSGLPVTYSVTLAAGWAMLIIALLGFGRAGDAIRQRTGSRALMIRIGAPLIALSGLLLTLSPSPGWLLIAWIAVQVPAAMVITAALAEAGELVPVTQRGLASGLIGAAPIMALLLGSGIATVLASSPSWALLITAVLGAALCAPLAVTGGTASTAPTQTPLGAVSRARVPWWAWPAFLAASFLLSWSTSTANGYIVPFVQNVTDVGESDIAGVSTGAVLAATVVATLSSIVGGYLAAGRPRGAWMWSGAAVTCGVGLIVLLVLPSAVGVVVAALLFGIAFGLANGVELGIVLLMRNDPVRLGRDLGLFTAVTAAPYVLVPAIATLMLADSTANGLIRLFALAVGLALLASVVVATLAPGLRSGAQRSTAPQA